MRPDAAADAVTRAKREARLLAYITRKGQATRAEILFDLSTFCGGERGIDTTLGALLTRHQIAITHGAKSSEKLGRKVAVYTIANTTEARQ